MDSPHTLKIMKVDKNLLRKRNFSSGIVGMVIGDKKNEKIIEEWAKFSENKDVVAPKEVAVKTTDKTSQFLIF